MQKTFNRYIYINILHTNYRLVWFYEEELPSLVLVVLKFLISFMNKTTSSLGAVVFYMFIKGI